MTRLNSKEIGNVLVVYFADTKILDEHKIVSYEDGDDVIFPLPCRLV